MKGIMDRTYSSGPVPMTVLEDKYLSLKAKGLYVILQYEVVKNDGYCSVKKLMELSKDGYESTNTAIKELEDAYLLYRDRLNNGRVKYELYGDIMDEALIT